MSGQPHVVLEMVEVVTDQLSDDSILFRHLLLQLNYFCLGSLELLFQDLNPTKLLSLHDHHIVRAVHCIVRLEERSNQSMLTTDLQFNQPLIEHPPSNDKDRFRQYRSVDDMCQLSPSLAPGRCVYPTFTCTVSFVPHNREPKTDA